MQRKLLAAALTAALLTRSSQARADSLENIFQTLLMATLVGVVVVGTAEVLTATATFKNLRAGTRREEPSGGWIGVGAVGGVANVALGSYLIVDSLPTTEEITCDTGRDPPLLPRAPGKPGRCLLRTPASTGGLIAGTAFTTFGLAALGVVGWAMKNAPDGRAQAGVAAPGTAPAQVGFVLPALRF
jgi:hypothetical protein